MQSPKMARVTSLQDQQKALLAAAQEEPSVAQVVEALDQLYPHFPATVTFPTYKTIFSIGANG